MHSFAPFQLCHLELDEHSKRRTNPLFHSQSYGRNEKALTAFEEHEEHEEIIKLHICICSYCNELFDSFHSSAFSVYLYAVGD